MGKETDILILEEDGASYEITDEQVEILDGIYQKEMKFGRENKELNKIIENLGGETNV